MNEHIAPVPSTESRIERIGRNGDGTIDKFKFHLAAESTAHRSRPGVVVRAIKHRRDGYRLRTVARVNEVGTGLIENGINRSDARRHGETTAERGSERNGNGSESE
ncbi:hypothetical protein A2U01_0061907 [Trifolium medium]|uniref:Uncharacterized protein n=1 Tax=Trifolium medium TaxID=97028 RepID=A0A392RX84_9FABA|nr:hypothetical protein [Trifolium medium]